MHSRLESVRMPLKWHFTTTTIKQPEQPIKSPQWRHRSFIVVCDVTGSCACATVLLLKPTGNVTDVTERVRSFEMAATEDKNRGQWQMRLFSYLQRLKSANGRTCSQGGTENLCVCLHEKANRERRPARYWGLRIVGMDLVNPLSGLLMSVIFLLHNVSCNILVI